MNQRNKYSADISPAKWLENAKNDLKLAEIGAQYDVIASLICFHAQQAAEKAFCRAVRTFRQKLTCLNLKSPKALFHSREPSWRDS
ncbi:MAG: HEPN domain-containing protein [Calditrichaeota bacterium]|nr:HEPN domain-containing protein [Calditrichota bacterium]